jgi:hypothetical protein
VWKRFSDSSSKNVGIFKAHVNGGRVSAIKSVKKKKKKKRERKSERDRHR